MTLARDPSRLCCNRVRGGKELGGLLGIRTAKAVVSFEEAPLAGGSHSNLRGGKVVQIRMLQSLCAV